MKPCHLQQYGWTLGVFMLSETSQTKKKKRKTNTVRFHLLVESNKTKQIRNRPTNTDKLMVAKREEEGRNDRKEKFFINMY